MIPANKSYVTPLLNSVSGTAEANNANFVSDCFLDEFQYGFFIHA